MPKIDDYEFEVLSAFEQGQLKSAATKAELAKFKAAAHGAARLGADAEHLTQHHAAR